MKRHQAVAKIGFFKKIACCFVPFFACATPVSYADDVLSTLDATFEAFARRTMPSSALFQTTVFAAVVQNQQILNTKRIQMFCERIDRVYKRFSWGQSPCLDLPWTFKRVSERGEPLVYWEYVNPTTAEDPERFGTTLVLGGVHPDENTPIHMAFKLAKELHDNPSLYDGQRVVIAPVVNPDGLFKPRATRTNANGVDLNRNLPTKDWWDKATKHWNANRRKDPRHFPGFTPRSEEGTRFQMDLLSVYEPDKVLTIHAPLGFLDYDGPGDDRSKDSQDKRARELVFTIARNSRNYQVKGFPIYPGSLGNFSGNERAIPTVTLELGSSDPRMATKFWNNFYPGLKTAIRFDFKRKVLAQLESSCHATFCIEQPNLMLPIIFEK